MLFRLRLAVVVSFFYYLNILLFILKDLYLNLAYTNNPTPYAVILYSLDIALEIYTYFIW